MNFQEMIARLIHYWSGHGCVVHQGYDLEVGAGTFNPATFLRCLGPEPYRAVYVEPSRRPQDGRYGENPNRVQFYHQMQVILKPSPPGLQEIYLDSLEAIGLDLISHDVRFVHDDWENPTIGAWGLGWEIWIDGMEVTQFTYFQSVGGVAVKPVSGELTYGLERLAMYLQGVESIFDIKWNDGLTFGDIYHRSEWEWSHYNFKEANIALWESHFNDFEREAQRLTEIGFPIPAYDFIMKASHAFNMLDARGVISITERAHYIGRIRNLARRVADAYIKSREEQRFPLLRSAPLQPEKRPVPEMKTRSAGEKEDFLLEIGTEELPSLFVPIGLASLEHTMRGFLHEQGIEYENMKLYGTPRRLAISIKQLASETKSHRIERKGPAIEKAYDNHGNPVQAGIGFFSALGMQPVPLAAVESHPQLEIKSLKGAAYLFASMHVPGKPVLPILIDHLKSLILSLDFPKKMRWGSEEIAFARPIRWIVSLFGKEEVPFQIGAVFSGRTTRGHRQLADAAISLDAPDRYLSLLEEHFVQADQCERQQSILQQIKEIEHVHGAQAVALDKVLPQVLHLVEWPFLTVGSFDPAYLRAPKEILISEMVEHQKYFPLAHPTGELMPKFIIVCNNHPSDLIRKGNERALSARLADGVFLFEEDLKTPLEEFNRKLETITFQKELGSVWQKVSRLGAFVEILHSYLPICPLPLALRAAELCKADLASELVGEFPDLQGIIGKSYALHHHEPEEVAQAIDEHWMPRGEQSPLPQTASGILVSLADKIDNLISFFALDLKPTSSSDPHGLRRQALGIIKTLIKAKQHLPFRRVFNECFEVFLLNPEISPLFIQDAFEKKESILAGIEQFFLSRLRTVLSDAFEKDEIEAVLHQGLQDIYDLYRRVAALQQFRKTNTQEFNAILEMFTRTKKILLSQKKGLIPEWQANRPGMAALEEQRFPPLNPELLEDENEKRLYIFTVELRETFHREFLDRRALENRDYTSSFSLLAKLKNPVAALFDHVKVIADDPVLRANRLALLQQVWDLCEELVDFSKIQQLH